MSLTFAPEWQRSDGHWIVRYYIGRARFLAKTLGCDVTILVNGVTVHITPDGGGRVE